MGIQGLWNEKIKPPITANHNLSPKLIWMNNSKIRVRFRGSCLKQDKITFTPRNVVHLFIVYESDVWQRNLNTVSTLKDCVFGFVKLTKNNYPDKYSYSGYGIDSHSFFSISNFLGKNVIFGVGNSSSEHTDNKKKFIS